MKSPIQKLTLAPMHLRTLTHSLPSSLCLVLALAGATPAMSATCGTVASPSACTVVLEGNTLFEASAFTLLNTASSGGAITFQAGDIGIDLSTSGGNAVLRFAFEASGPSNASSWFTNAGGSTSFSVSYAVDLTPTQPGIVELTSIGLGGTFSTTANGSAVVQFIISGIEGPCLAFNGNSSTSCLPPPALGTSFVPGNILSLTGNTGNAAALNYTNTFDTTFRAAPVPEPASLVMMGLGLAGLLMSRRRR